MKNKKLLYVLIPAVIFIWGAIIYKVVIGLSGSDGNSFQEIKMTEIKSNEVSNDTFSINPTYRDPFSGKRVKNSNPISGSFTNQLNANTSPQTKWPEIIYGGIVKNQKSNKQLVLVQINGQSNIMKAEETFNNIEVTKVFKDSIEVKFGKEKKFIKK